MGTAHETLLKQLRITTREISRRKEFFSFSDTDISALKTLHPMITENIHKIVEKFYQHILPFNEIDRLIGDAETLEKLRNHQKMYILTLFQGQYDEEYIHSRLRIGVVHKRIGVEPKFYVSAVHTLSTILKDTVITHSSGKQTDYLPMIAAIDKILMFDLSLTFDTYIHSLMDEIRRSQEELERYTESLEHLINDRTELLKQQARVDGLTGLINQSHFYESLSKEISRSQRRGHTISLLYCDLDGFKPLNDNHGHRMGDKVLKDVAAALRESVRQDESIARYGGDEFCVIVPEGDIKEAENLAQRIIEILRKKVSNYAITCSIGIASSTPENSLDAAGLVRKADEAMYIAKETKGFSIHIAED